MATRPPIILQSEPSLDVPEEPEREDNETGLDSDSITSSGSVIQFVTAVRIARWMARAYGYVAQKRQSYLDQGMIGSNRLSLEELQVSKLTKRDLGSRKSSFFDFDLKKDEELETTSGLLNLDFSGDEVKDMEKIRKWFASSYGETNKDYHDAVSREIIRQMKQQSMTLNPEGASTLKKSKSWF